MSIDQKSAEEIVSAINKASALCNESLRILKVNDSLGHVEVYGRLVGNFLGRSYTNILAPIWDKHPNIEPPEMKVPYVEPEPMLSAESQAALRAFLIEAHTSLEIIKRQFPTQESMQFLKFGGLVEVENTVKAIEEFLERPRFRDTDLES